MDAPNEHTAFWQFVMKRLIPRYKRLIPRWEYRYLRVVAGTDLAGGLFVLGLAALALSSGYDGWAALLLEVAALLFSFGSLNLMVIRPAPRRT